MVRKTREIVMAEKEKLTIGRRNFMKAAVAIPAAGAYAYSTLQARPLQAAIIGTGNQGRVLLENAHTSYLNIVATCDFRPDHRLLGEAVIQYRYNPKVRVYKDVDKMLSDGGFEAVIIATPLHTHGPLSVKCLSAGKHVLCEKTMAYSLEQCDEMIATAERNNLVLAIGHQRHANPLYLQAKDWVEKKEIGDVYHIRSLWHRNNEWRNVPDWENEVLKEKWGQTSLEWLRKKLPEMKPKDFVAMPTTEKVAHYFELLKEKDPDFDWVKQGYETPDQMANWRLFSKYSHGLMSELGSHQIDVATWLWGAPPETVCGVGGIYHYKDERDVNDHAYVTFRYPDNKVFTFTAITTNAFDDYYDQIMGTKGTIYLTGESEGMLIKTEEAKAEEALKKKTEMAVGKGQAGKPAAVTHQTGKGGGTGDSIGDGKDRFKAYGEEIRKFAEAVRTGDPSRVGCSGEEGRRAAAAVLASNEAMRTNVVQTINLNSKVV
jgi:predicted dehydrogenase